MTGRMSRWSGVHDRRRRPAMARRRRQQAEAVNLWCHGRCHDDTAPGGGL